MVAGIPPLIHMSEADTPSEIKPDRPQYDALVTEYGAIQKSFAEAADADARASAVLAWDALCRRVGSWSALVHLKFDQNTNRDWFLKLSEILVADLLEARIYICLHTKTPAHKPPTFPKIARPRPPYASGQGK